MSVYILRIARFTCLHFTTHAENLTRGRKLPYRWINGRARNWARGPGIVSPATICFKTALLLCACVSVLKHLQERCMRSDDIYKPSESGHADFTVHSPLTLMIWFWYDHTMESY